MLYKLIKIIKLMCNMIFFYIVYFFISLMIDRRKYMSLYFDLQKDLDSTKCNSFSYPIAMSDKMGENRFICMWDDIDYSDRALEMSKKKPDRCGIAINKKNDVKLHVLLANEDKSLTDNEMFMKFGKNADKVKNFDYYYDFPVSPDDSEEFNERYFDIWLEKDENFLSLPQLQFFLRKDIVKSHFITETEVKTCSNHIDDYFHDKKQIKKDIQKLNRAWAKYKQFPLLSHNIKNTYNALFRNGYPRITETMDQHTMRRSTGLYGSGLYAYCDYIRAKQDEKDVYKIDTHLYNLYPIEKLDNIIDFSSDLLYATRRYMNEKDRKDYNKYIDSAFKKSSKIPLQNQITKNEIRASVEESAKCLLTMPKNTCSQPINRLLYSRGYDGILPNKNACNNNSFGSVIFKEAIARNEKIPIDTLQSYKNLDIGQKIY